MILCSRAHILQVSGWLSLLPNGVEEMMVSIWHCVLGTDEDIAQSPPNTWVFTNSGAAMPPWDARKMVRETDGKKEVVERERERGRWWRERERERGRWWRERQREMEGEKGRAGGCVCVRQSL